MGQTEIVHVHRLLASDSVDERMVEVLQGKLDVFRKFADPSLIKDASAEATETRFSATLMEVERARLQASA